MILTEENLEILLDSCGIDIVSGTLDTFIGYCPFHTNRDSPALNVAKDYPYGWRCWNPSCGLSGSLLELVQRTRKEDNPLAAMRHITSFQKSGLTLEVLQRKVNNRLTKENNIDEQTLIACEIDLDTSQLELAEMTSRGITKETMKRFEIGYSKVKKRITIPLRDEAGVLVGISGRATQQNQQPKYRESRGFEKNKVLFNMANAKLCDTIVVVEGPIDAMKVDQAGFPGVVATLGNSFSDYKAKLLQRYADSIIVFTDNDQAGRDLARDIERRLGNKKIFYARYPKGVKDPGEMTDEQIQDAINNKQSKMEKYLEKLQERRT